MKDRLEVGFGTVVEIQGSDIKAIVLDVGGEGDVDVAGVYESEDGLKMADPGGLDPNRIVKVTGQLSKEEVLATVQRGFEQRGYQLTCEMREELEKLSEKEPRAIG